MASKNQRHSKGRRGDSNTEAEDLFRLNFQEALEDTQIADKLARIIRSTNQDLLDSLGSLRSEVRSLRKELSDRDAAIANLQAEVKVLRQDNDALEQYGRRNNLRISGIPEVNLQPEQTETRQEPSLTLPTTS